MVNQTQVQPASLNPDDLGAGGIFDALLTIKSGEFRHNTFTPTEGPDKGKSIRNFEVKMTYIKEDGTDVEWTYSVGAADAWNPSADGLSALPTKDGGKISQTSAFGTFLTELVNAGFPKNQLTGSLDSMFGTQIQSVGMTRKGAEAGSKQVLVAKLVVGIPSEVGGNHGVTPPTPSRPATPKAPSKAQPKVVVLAATSNGTGNAQEDALTSAQKLGDTFKLPDVMTQTMLDYAEDEARRDAAAGYVFQPAFLETLAGAGYSVDGVNVSR